MTGEGAATNGSGVGSRQPSKEIAAFLALAIILPAATASAASDRRDFRKHVSSAETHYGLAEYLEAAADWRAAYEIHNKPALLLDMAQAFRLARDYENARTEYQNYLRALPQAPNKAEVKNRIRTMTRDINHPPKHPRDPK